VLGIAGALERTMRSSIRLPRSFVFASTMAVAAYGVGAVTAAAPAAAGPYLSLGLGSQPDLADEMQGFEAASRSGRLELGQRFSIAAVEGGLGGYRLTTLGAAEYDAVSVSGGGKLFFTLSGPLGLLARGGVERTWLRGDGAADYSGNGYYAGVGAELRLALPLGDTSVWVDYSVHRATLRSGSDELKADSGMWTAGLSIGI
jgi:hypothetical protein